MAAVKVKLNALKIQDGTERTVYATWTIASKYKANTSKYRCVWYYKTDKDTVWFVGNDSEVDVRQSTYSAPENAAQVKCSVKPIAKTKTVESTQNNKTVKTEVSLYTSGWVAKTYDMSKLIPTQATTPTIAINETNNLQLDISLTNIDTAWTALYVRFQVKRDDKTTCNDQKVALSSNTAKRNIYLHIPVAAGHRYKVRCAGVRGTKTKTWSTGEWSDYSDNVQTIPKPTSGLAVTALSSTSIKATWKAISNITGYELQYTTNQTYFDANPSAVTSFTPEGTTNTAIITGMESGSAYYFRVRTTNSAGESKWSSIASTILGKKPSAPTTWSSTTTASEGDSVNLYWVHNTVDGSSQTTAILEIDGVETTIQNSTDEDEKDKTSVYTLTPTIPTGSSSRTVSWRVKTKGVTEEYSDWSVLRTIKVYKKPVLSVEVLDSSSSAVDTVTSFPFYISGEPNPVEDVIGYHLSITSAESYETVTPTGETELVSAGDEIFSEYYDLTGSALTMTMSADNIDLENERSYDISLTVSMSSGLTSEATKTFSVSWEDDTKFPDAEVEYLPDIYAARIRPYCYDDNDEEDILSTGVKLSVYRREFDGSFTKIAEGLDNTNTTYVVDPHPALNYACYRIVAIVDSTGAVSYYDIPGEPVNEPAAILQWEESYSNFEVSTIDEDDEPENPIMSATFLRLLYNLDVSDSSSPDVSMVKYIGRKRPVSYYGTQLGESSSWNAEIDKTDTETLALLRRLAVWTGDVYVREPSGSGYWANVTVSFSQTHCELTIPVSLTITRVEGGM